MKFWSLLTGKFREKAHARYVFNEIFPHEEGFADHYNQHLKSHALAYEEKRVQALETARGRMINALLIGLLGVFLSIWVFLRFRGFGDVPGILLVINAIIIIGLSVWCGEPIKRYRGRIKRDIFPKILSFLGDYDFNAVCDRSIDHYSRWGIVPHHDREDSEDQIRGSHNGVDIELFETKLQQRRRSGKRTYYVTVFKGVAVSLTMHKRFHGKTIVVRDKGGVFNWIKDAVSGLERVALEDPQFEKQFEVYSSDQIEARYLLTTAFMDRLLGLRESLGGKSLECSFYDRSLLMMIAVDRNLFEPGSVFDPEDFVDDARALLRDMQIINEIIDTLKLDQNIGL